jgi:hypothetical protein
VLPHRLCHPILHLLPHRNALQPTLSQPAFVTSTPTPARLTVSVANGTFTAG